MPKALTAKFPGTCCKCGQRFTVGTPITYSTKSGAGSRYFHAPKEDGTTGCFAAAAAAPVAAPVATSYSAPSVPVPQPQAIAAQVPVEPPVARKLVRKLKKLTATSPWYDIYPHLLEAGITRILLIGPPGPGKSYTGSEAYTWPRVLCNPDMGSEDTLGTFMQINGNTVWVNGPNVEAMMAGTPVVWDELDRSSQETMSLAYMFLDDAPEARLPNGTRVKAQPGYAVIATSNEKTTDIPEPILDRIECVLICATPSPAQIDMAWAEAVKNPKFAGDRAAAESYADKVVGAMKNYYRLMPTSNWEWSGKPTIRRTRNFTKLVNYGIPQEIAAQLVMGSYGRDYLASLVTASAVTA